MLPAVWPGAQLVLYLFFTLAPAGIAGVYGDGHWGSMPSSSPLRELYELLLASDVPPDHITIFSADGADPQLDVAVLKPATRAEIGWMGYRTTPCWPGWRASHCMPLLCVRPTNAAALNACAVTSPARP